MSGDGRLVAEKDELMEWTCLSEPSRQDEGINKSSSSCSFIIRHESWWSSTDFTCSFSTRIINEQVCSSDKLRSASVKVTRNVQDNITAVVHTGWLQRHRWLTDSLLHTLRSKTGTRTRAPLTASLLFLIREKIQPSWSNLFQYKSQMISNQKLSFTDSYLPVSVRLSKSVWSDTKGSMLSNISRWTQHQIKYEILLQ